MKGNEEVIAILNEVPERRADRHQSILPPRGNVRELGLHEVASYGRKESIDEMKHAEALMERILYLDGMPTMSELFPLRIGRNVKEQIENDLALELDAIPRLNRGIALCVQVADNGTRELLVKILTDEEHHVDFLEAQLHMIQEIGLDNYLAQQIHGEDH